MSDSEFGIFTVLLFVLVGAAHLLGYLFVRLRQPRVVGEICAGVLLGPVVLGHFAPALSNVLFFGNSVSGNKHQVVLGFLYNLGLLLLMFVSGAEVKGLFNLEDRRQITFLGIVGTAIPFLLVIFIAPHLPLAPLIGPAGQKVSLLLVLGIAMAVTSIPVISKILHDLGILRSRFARLVLGVAVIEDIVLWAVLAVATALAKSGTVPERQIILHVVAAISYFAVGMLVMPHLFQRLSRARWNLLAKTSPVAYLIVVLLAYAAAASLFDVSLVFAAFLAGYGISVRIKDFGPAIDSISKVSYAFFIPIYFAVVGYRLDLTRSFSFSMLAVFLVAACAVKILSAGLGARLARFSWSDSFNLAIALNARGGPGIVLASVAAGAGIISAALYTTLVLIAIFTSQLTGAWLDYVLRKDMPLLASEKNIIHVEGTFEGASLGDEVVTDLMRSA